MSFNFHLRVENGTFGPSVSRQLPPQVSLPSDQERIGQGEVSCRRIIYNCCNTHWTIGPLLQGTVPSGFEVVLRYFQVMQVDKASRSESQFY